VVNVTGPKFSLLGGQTAQNSSISRLLLFFASFQFLLRGGVFEGPGVSRFPHFLCTWERPRLRRSGAVAPRRNYFVAWLNGSSPMERSVFVLMLSLPTRSHNASMRVTALRI
jgi:hypothetical protein